MRPVGHELDEHGAEDGPGHGGQSADHDADQEGDRAEHVEAVRRHVGDGHRAQGAGHARVGGADAEGQRLVERGVDAHRLGGDRVVADGHDGPPRPPAQQVGGQDEGQDQQAEAQEVEPLVGIELEAPGGLRLAQHDALRATRPVLEVFQDLRHRQRQREGRQGEVEPLQTQGRDPEQEADDQAHETGHRNRPAVRDVPLVDHDRGRVRAHRVEGAVAERDLAVVAGEDVEAEQRHRVDVDLGELEQPEVAQREGQHQGHHETDPRHGERPGARRHQTRCTATRPNRPLGRTTRTIRISASATVSFSSVPMNFT